MKLAWSIGEPSRADAPRDASTRCIGAPPLSRKVTANFDPLVSPLRMQVHGRRERGFTLVELLIAMSIIVTLATMAIPSMLAAINFAKVGKATGDIRTLETEIFEYQISFGQLPDDLSQIGRPNMLDPWGTPYQYLNHATMRGNGAARKDRFLVPLNSDYDLYSDGQDGQSSAPITASKSQDDIIRASDGAYVGLASQF